MFFFTMNILNFRFFIQRKIRQAKLAGVKITARQKCVFAYIIVSLSLLIIVGFGLITGIFLLDKFKNKERIQFYDRFLGSFEIIFTIHDFMFATIILGIFYFLGLKAKSSKSISKRGGNLRNLNTSGNNSGKNLGTREIHDILNNPTERNNSMLDESERMNSQTAVLLEEDSEKP